MKNSRSQERLDWITYNFLENLLIFCVCKTCTVPPESGVKFHLNSINNSASVCLLFHVDRIDDPLLSSQEGPRPDYVVFYATPDILICTIIEMKGKSEKNLSHGIDQIKAFRDRLRSEMTAHLPKRMRVKMQGILLSPYNSDIPREKIVREARNGLTIVAPQSNHCADLSGLVTRELRLTDKIEHTKVTRKAYQLNDLERILVNGGQRHRIKDTFFSKNYSKETVGRREGIYINYRTNNSAYVAVFANRSGCSIATKGENSVVKWLSKSGFAVGRQIAIQSIGE